MVWVHQEFFMQFLFLIWSGFKLGNEITMRPKALVTGSAKGIGRSIAIQLAKDGYDIIVNYNTSASAAKSTCNEVSKFGGTVLSCKADVSSRKEIEILYETVKSEFGSLNVLVNNAGILEQKPFGEISDEDWQSTFDANLKSAFLCTQLMSNLILPGGSIVNISSIGGEIGGPKAVHYAASKGAMITFTKSTARVLSERGIRVNAVSPGFINTGMFQHITSVQNTSLNEIEETIPLGRVGTPQDVANAVSFLANDKSNYITGQVIRVNGGLLI
jgi:3-oxoacyl-[acyl-carrier protein] reductase